MNANLSCVQAMGENVLGAIPEIARTLARHEVKPEAEYNAPAVYFDLFGLYMVRKLRQTRFWKLCVLLCCYCACSCCRCRLALLYIVHAPANFSAEFQSVFRAGGLLPEGGQDASQHTGACCACQTQLSVTQGMPSCSERTPIT